MGRPFVNVMLVAVALLSACTLSETPAPPLQGPSELGLSLTTFANPDVLSQDGASQSLIVVQAYDANGQPARNVSFRVEITVGGVVTDFGSLSARTLVTGNDGRATVTYTAPPPPLVSVDTNASVTIRLTPSSGNSADAQSRFVQIRLVPPGTILPGGPTPNFTITPAAPAAFTDVLFDGTTSTAAVGTVITSFSWSFGDGGTASGPVVSHRFGPGSFLVTLTVTDSNNIAASRSQQVTVAAGTLPTASFVFSPTAPTVLQDIFFNGAASTAAAGRTIVRYDWNFGSGTPRTGQTVTKSYDAAGTYNVQLSVTDDVGQVGRTTQTVIVSQSGGQTTGLTASFTVSPSAPTTGNPVSFNGSGSTFQPGFPIVSFDWDFGNGVTASGPSAIVTHAYSAAGTYTARLTIRDTLGRTATATSTVPVAASGISLPTASFFFSPSPAKVNETITFDARNSTPSSGATIDHFEWSWGDGSPIEQDKGSNKFHTYSKAGTYTVTLTVVDSVGRRGSTSQSVVVQ